LIGGIAGCPVNASLLGTRRQINIQKMKMFRSLAMEKKGPQKFRTPPRMKISLEFFEAEIQRS